jgi:opacity protein-like surface antigen
MKKIVLAALAAAFVGSGAQATDFHLVSQNVGGVATSGTIKTDGTLGVLSSGNITGFDITLSSPGFSDEELSNANASFYLQGSYLTATATGLYWNYAQGVGAEFSITPTSAPYNVTQFHFYTNRTDVDFHYGEQALYLNGVQLVGTASVPEPASWAMMVGGFGLLGGAMRRRKASVSVA